MRITDHALTELKLARARVGFGISELQPQVEYCRAAYERHQEKMDRLKRQKASLDSAIALLEGQHP
jgi:hypothetical protein